MQTGGPYYPVELGRLDGKVGTRAVVKHSLPGAGFDLDQLNKLFAANGLTQTDMIALSGACASLPLLFLFSFEKLYCFYFDDSCKKKNIHAIANIHTTSSSKRNLR